MEVLIKWSSFPTFHVVAAKNHEGEKSREFFLKMLPRVFLSCIRSLNPLDYMSVEMRALQGKGFVSCQEVCEEKKKAKRQK